MPDELKLIDALFWAGAALAAILLWAARGPYSMWMVQLPGTLAHELAHYLVALVTLSSPSPMSLQLKRTAQTWELGSITFRPGRWTAGLVALAPAWVLPLCVYGLWREAGVSGATFNIIAGYLAVTLALGSVPSRTDWAIAFRYPVGTFILFAVAAALFWGTLFEKG